jgi:hypothetical protein
MGARDSGDRAASGPTPAPVPGAGGATGDAGRARDSQRLFGNGRLVLPTMSAPVLLARPLPGTVGETQRVAHLFPVPVGATERLTALCGASFPPGELEVLDRPHGMPCTACLSRAPSPRASRRPGIHASTPARSDGRAKIPERARGARVARGGRNRRRSSRATSAACRPTRPPCRFHPVATVAAREPAHLPGQPRGPSGSIPPPFRSGSRFEAPERVGVLAHHLFTPRATAQGLQMWTSAPGTRAGTLAVQHVRELPNLCCAFSSNGLIAPSRSCVPERSPVRRA